MIRKFTSVLLFALASAGAMAQEESGTFTPTAYADGDATTTFYTIASYNRGGVLSQTGTGNDVGHVTAEPLRSWWYFTAGSADGAYYLYNAYNKKAFGTNNGLNDTPADRYILPNGVNDKGYVISTTNPISGSSCIDANNYNTGIGTWNPSSTDWEGTTWVFSEVEGVWVTSVNGLPGSNADHSGYYSFTSGVITLPSATSKVRFTVYDTNNQAKTSKGYPFFTIGEFKIYDADGAEVSLTSDAYATNAQETSEGPLANICDGSQSTFFHSTWSAAGPSSYHYIEVTLPEEMSSLKFSFDSRNGNNVPTLIQILTAEQTPRVDAVSNLQSRITAVDGNITIGTGYNNYTNGEGKDYATALSDAKSVVASSTATTEELTAALATLNEAVSALVINTPADGAFLRVRSSSSSRGMRYLSSANASIITTRAQFQNTSETDAANLIFYYKDGKLLSYGSGHYLTNQSNFLGYNGVVTSDGAAAVAFSAAKNGTFGQYNVTLFGNASRYLYCQTKTANDVTEILTDADGGGTSEFNNYWLEDVTTLPVTIGTTGYATLYAPVALTIPSGVTAYTVKMEEEKGELTEVSGTIPAETGVVLKGEAATYDFTINSSYTTPDDFDKGDLTGSTPSFNATADSGYFILFNGSVGVGFYAINDANDVEVHGNRAYYLNISTPAPAFSLSYGESTGISGVTATENTDAPVYDLSGRRVAKTGKGLYIQGGRKIYVK